MSTTNYPSGSKLNPISEEIHQRDVARHNWLGGWVGTSDNPTYYDRQNEERTCSGSHSAPYDADVYDELTDNAMWIGGWVLEEDENGEPVDFPTYFTATGTAYPGEDEEENVFGNEDNPIPIDVYEEMCELDIWTGGWVVYPNGTTEEFPENEGGASGSGSGSGCGCGCGNNDAGCGCGCGEDEGGGSGCGGDGYVTVGGEEIITREGGNLIVNLTWNSGYSGPFATPPCSYLNTSTVYHAPIIILSNTLSSVWEAQYLVRVKGKIEYKISESSSVFTLEVDATYSIPNMYCTHSI